MGREATCTARHAGKTSAGKALLETAELVFRGDFRVAVRFEDITTVSAGTSKLTVRWPGGTLVLDLGAQAERWAQRIRNPPTRLDKLGVKATSIVALLGGARDATRPGGDAELELFVTELGARGATVVRGTIDAGALDVENTSDILFLWLERRDDLRPLARLARSMRDDAALWVLRPKGSAAVSESDVRAAAKAARLVDVKVAAFSATRTAEKLVIPVAARGAGRATARKATGRGARATS